MEAQLDEALARAVAACPGPEELNPLAAVARRTAAHRRRRRRVGVGGAAALMGCAVLGASAWLRVNEEPQRVVTEPEPSVTMPSPSVGADGVTALDPGPLATRSEAAAVWTGEEVVVWGGDLEFANVGLPGEPRQYADGAAYEPASATWRTLAPSPLPATAETPVATWTGTEVVIARGERVAAYDPAADTWRALPDAPLVALRLEWTGEEVLAVGGGPEARLGIDRVNLDRAAALDPGGDTWRTLPAPPVVLERANATWTGEELVVLGSGGGTTKVLALDPVTGGWRELPPPLDLTGLASGIAWDGASLVAVDHEGRAAAYDPDEGTWESLQRVPTRFSEGSVEVLVSGDATVALMQQAVAVRDGDGWVAVPYDELALGGPPVVAGDRLYGFGFDYGASANAFAAVEPARLAASRRLQVGLVPLDLPEGFELASMRAEGEAGFTPAVVAEVARRGTVCSVTATYAPFTDAPAATAAQVVLPDPNGSDVVVVSCPDQATADELAAGVGADGR